MNKKNVKKLRETLIAVADGPYPNRFAMRDYFDYYKNGDSFNPQHRGFFKNENYFDPNPEHCGCAACLGGWAALLNPDFSAKDYMNGRGKVALLSADYLGLTANEAEFMFMGKWTNKYLDEITIDDAIDYLEKVIKSDDVFIEEEVAV